MSAELASIVEEVLAEHPRYDRPRGSRYPAVCEGCGAEVGARFAGTDTLIAAQQRHQAERIVARLDASELLDG